VGLHYHLAHHLPNEGFTMNKSGIVLIVIGCLFLALNFGLLEWVWLRQWWPLILIALGVWSLINHKASDNRSSDKNS